MKIIKNNEWLIECEMYSNDNGMQYVKMIIDNDIMKLDNDIFGKTIELFIQQNYLSIFYRLKSVTLLGDFDNEKIWG